MMKKICNCLFLIAISVPIFTQAPMAFSYQAVLRNLDGTVQVNQEVVVQMNIHQMEVSGPIVYREEHETRTNQLGMITLSIGNGTTTQDFSSIDWADGPYFLEILVDEVSLGTSQLLSVPYALYAASGIEGPPGPKGDKGEQGPPGDDQWTSVTEGLTYQKGNVGIGTDMPTENLDVGGNLRVRGSLWVEGGTIDEDLLRRLELLESMNGIGQVTDQHGNVYKTVRIGKQNWMAENLKATSYADGSPIPLVDTLSWYYLEDSAKAFCWYENDSATGNVYGTLFTWAAAMNGTASSDANPSGIQGVCPDGWHLPSDAEWKDLEMELGMNPEETHLSGSRGIDEGDKLKEAGTTHWSDPNNKGTNESGFSALPGGSRYIDFNGLGIGANFWTTTEDSNSTRYAWIRGLSANSSRIHRGNYPKPYGFSVRCVEGFGLPVVRTSIISNVTPNFAEGGGEVMQDGGSEVYRCGLCWSTHSEPTVEDNSTWERNENISFSSRLKWLDPGTTYHVRAYAENRAGTGYGNEITFTTLTDPVVPIVKARVYGIRSTSVHAGGEVLDNGGTTVIERGVCWGTSENPAIHDHKTSDGTGIGIFGSNPTGLNPNTTYFIRAYATNSVGTGYGVQQSIATLNQEQLLDIDGNSYYKVQIGSQIWMGENLRVTHYADGSLIPYVDDPEQWDSLSTSDRAYCWYDNSAANGLEFGALYTWACAMNGNAGTDMAPSGIQGVCPEGWHLPSDEEWKEMEMYLGMSREEADYGYKERGEIIGGKLKESGTMHWLSSHESVTNESGFSAFPGGVRRADGGFYFMGTEGNFWTTTETDEERAQSRTITNEDYVLRFSRDKRHGFSVRCMED